MEPERLNFLNRFDKFYRILINSLKEKKIDEKDFYLMIITKARDMDRERRGKKRERGPSQNREEIELEKDGKSFKKLIRNPS